LWASGFQTPDPSANVSQNGFEAPRMVAQLRQLRLAI